MFDFVPDMAAKRAELDPDAIAFTEAETGKKWTFLAFERAANNLANSFDAMQISQGDRIAILCKNNVEFFVALFACQKTGAILAALNWRQPVAELQPALKSIGARALIFDEHNQATARALIQENDLISITIGSAKVAENQFNDLASGPGQRPRQNVDVNRPWYLLFTSGTTGTPKAVIQTAKMAWANAINIGQAIGIQQSDVGVCFLPLFHTAGINLYTLPLFLNGGHSIVLPQFDEDFVVDLLAKNEITQFFGVPAIYQALSLREDFDQMSFDHARFGCGGAAMPIALVREFSKRGARVCNGFGMTETGPTAFFMDEENIETKIGSVGKVHSLTQYRLDSVEDGKPGTGEIQFYGPAITPGYFENAGATAATFTHDGWLKTGDVGKRDDDGYVFIVDRIKDMYISGGENVYPAEVEKVLITHQDILEAAIIGVSDPKWGEIGAAFLLPKPNKTIDISSLNSWCRQHLAAYKIPKSFHIVEDFPRTAAGKIRKPLLKEMFEHAEI